MNEKNNKLVPLIILVLLSGFVGASFIMQHYANDSIEEYHKLYYIQYQFIGDVGGYENCLVMEVNPVTIDLYKDPKISTETQWLYFANEHELWKEGIENVIIDAVWIEDKRNGYKKIKEISLSGITVN